MEEATAFEAFRQLLGQPEYLHVLLNPLPVYGLGLGAFALIIALLLRSRAAQITALTLIFVCALSAWPVAVLGDRGYDKIESMSDTGGYRWLDAHAQRATRAMPLFFVLAGVALAALVLPWKFPKTALPWCGLTLLLTFAALCAGAWIGHAGGAIRHKEFRRGLPPEPKGGYEGMR